MGLITLALLVMMTAVYLDKHLEAKPPFFNQIVAFTREHIKVISLWGMAYAAAVAFLSFSVMFFDGSFFIRFVANKLVLLMLVPFLFAQYKEGIMQMIGAKPFEFISKIMKFIEDNGKYVGYAGAVVATIMFLVMFK